MQSLHRPDLSARIATTPARVLIVGAGHAGGRVAQQLRALGYTDRIGLVGAESRTPYERPALSKELLLGTRQPDELAIESEAAWQRLGVDLLLDSAVERLDRERCEAVLADGRRLPYDLAVVATGGSARRLRLPGADDPRVLTLRTLADALTLRERLGSARRLVIVGGGVIGLELATSARALGVEVTLLETAERVMARVVCEQGSAWLAAVHRAAGVRLHLGSTPTRIAAGPDGLRVHVRLADGSDEAIAADLVVAAVGIEVNSTFLRDSGLGDGDGMQVDATCRSTVDPNCYAAGDVARTPSDLHGRAVRQETWRNADNQARAVAEFICGRTEPYVELPWMWSDQHGCNLQVVGIHHGHDEVVRRASAGRPEFALLWLRRGRLLGGALVDCGRERRPLERLVAAGARPDPRRLADASIALKDV